LNAAQQPKPVHIAGTQSFSDFPSTQFQADSGPFRTNGNEVWNSSKLSGFIQLQGKYWRRGPGSNRRIKVLQFSGPRLSRYESRALPLGEVPKNGFFSTHFSLIGSLTAARTLSSSSALLVSAGSCMLSLSVIVTGQSSGPDDSRILNPFRFSVKFRLQAYERWKPGLFRALINCVYISLTTLRGLSEYGEIRVKTGQSRVSEHGWRFSRSRSV